MLVILAEDSGLVASTHMANNNHPVPAGAGGGSVLPSSGLLRHCIHIGHGHTSKRNTRTHKHTQIFTKKLSGNVVHVLSVYAQVRMYVHTPVEDEG